MPDQMMELDELIVWRANGDSSGTDIFIFSHGGYIDDEGRVFELPDYDTGYPRVLFYGYRGTSISEVEANEVIGLQDPAPWAKMIIRPGAPCWNYLLEKYDRDWFEAATRAAAQAFALCGVQHDCLLIKDSAGGVLLSDVIDALVNEKGCKYINFHFMACRSIVS